MVHRSRIYSKLSHSKENHHEITKVLHVSTVQVMYTMSGRKGDPSSIIKNHHENERSFISIVDTQFLLLDLIILRNVLYFIEPIRDLQALSLIAIKTAWPTRHGKAVCKSR